MHTRCRIIIFSLVFILLNSVSFILYLPDVIASESAYKMKQDISAVALTVTPREIDFGSIRPSEGIKGTFILQNAGSDLLEWSITGPQSWILLETQKLTGSLRDKPESIKVHISSLREYRHEEGGKIKNYFHVQMNLEARNKLVSYQKRMASGMHREMLKLVFNGETITLFVRFKLVSAVLEPVVDVDQTRLYFGIVKQGEQVARRVKVTNKGMGTLKWDVDIQKDMHTLIPFANSHYVSFLNEDTRGSGIYTPPSYLKDAIDLSGKWAELGGYPSSNTFNHILSYRFSGTGISVLFSVEPDGGEMSAFIDEGLIISQECYAGPKERAECIVAEGLPYGNHTLILAGYGTQLIIEGVRVYGKEIMKGAPGWISISPDSGTTNRETDYVNITINTKLTNPGTYGENIVFDSNGGKAVVEVSLEVSEDTSSKTIDVYRYIMDSDYLYTSNPQEDSQTILYGGYKKQGIAFRLFSPGTPGTKPFYRWYHSGKRIHYYSHNQPIEGKVLNGYVLEGTIGNIATSRLTNTKALYRWYNPLTTSNFYTTDPGGEGHLKKGYRFEEIAGYVR